MHLNRHYSMKFLSAFWHLVMIPAKKRKYKSQPCLNKYYQLVLGIMTLPVSTCMCPAFQEPSVLLANWPSKIQNQMYTVEAEQTVSGVEKFKSEGFDS